MEVFGAMRRREGLEAGGAPNNPRLLQVIRQVPDEDYAPCLDDKDGEVAESGYRMAHDFVS